MVERQTENLKVESSILFVGNLKKKFINSYLSLFLEINLNYKKLNILKYSKNNSIELIKIKDYSIFFVEQNNKNKFSNFKIFQLFTILYLKNLYNINIIEKNINSINVLPKKLSKTFLYKVRNINFKQFKIKYFNEVGYLFLINI